MAEEVITGREIFEEPFRLIRFGDRFELEVVNGSISAYVHSVYGNYVKVLYGYGEGKDIFAEQINRCATKIYRQGEIIWQRSQQTNQAK